MFVMCTKYTNEICLNQLESILFNLKLFSSDVEYSCMYVQNADFLVSYRHDREMGKHITCL